MKPLNSERIAQFAVFSLHILQRCAVNGECGRNKIATRESHDFFFYCTNVNNFYVSLYTAHNTRYFCAYAHSKFSSKTFAVLSIPRCDVNYIQFVIWVLMIRVIPNLSEVEVDEAPSATLNINSRHSAMRDALSSSVVQALKSNKHFLITRQCQQTTFETQSKNLRNVIFHITHDSFTTNWYELLFDCEFIHQCESREIKKYVAENCKQLKLWE